MLNHSRAKTFISALTRDSGVRYEEQEGVKPHISKTGAVVMPPYVSTYTEEQDKAYMTNLISQCYAKEFIQDSREFYKQEIDPESGFSDIYRSVCSHNQHRNKQGELIGADEYVESMVTDSMKQFDVEGASKEQQALKAFDSLCRSEWQTSTDGGMLSRITPEASDLLDKLLPFKDEYLNPDKSAKDNYNLAKKIGEVLEQENENEPEANGEDGESSDEGEGDPSEEGEGQGQGADGQEGQEDKQDEEGSQAGVGATSATKGELGKELVMGEIPKLDKVEDYYKPNEVTVKYSKDLGGRPCGYRSSIVDAMVGSLSKKVQNLLKIFSQVRYVGNKKRGRINKRALASISTGNEAVFRTKETKDILDTSVMLLVDSSGSMAGSRYTNSVAASAMLLDCLQGLHIPVAVQGYTTAGFYEPLTYVHKDFKERISTDTLIDRMTSNQIYLNGNADGESLLYAFECIRSVKTKRKIIIVMSDGRPVDGYNPSQLLKKVAKEIETKSNVELYSIGIQTESVKEFYSNTVVLNNVGQLEHTLLNLLKNVIIK